MASLTKLVSGRYKPYETASLQFSSSQDLQQDLQLEKNFDRPPQNHRQYATNRYYKAPHRPQSPQGQGLKVYKRQIVVPLTIWLFANYVLNHGIYRITPKDLELILGLHNQQTKYQDIHMLLDYDLIKPIDSGLYEVNVEVAEYVVRRIPHPPGKRVYSNQWRRENLPDWRTAQQRYQQWLNAVMYVTQGTSPPIADFAQFPVAHLRFPNGRCKPTIIVAGLYIIPSKELARRTVVYCADAGPVTVCSATLDQLLYYLNPPCPDCPPAVPYPTPCEPRVEGHVADFKGNLIPLSSLPHTARKYELGVVFTPREPLTPNPSDLFNLELSRRGGHPPHVRVVPRKGFVRDYLGSDPWQFCQAVEALVDYALTYALAHYQALAGYGSSGVVDAQELFARAYESRRRKPTVSPSLSSDMFLRNVWVDVKVGRRWQSFLLDKELRADRLTCGQVRAKVSRMASFGRVRVSYFELLLYLPDRDGTLSRDMAIEYDYLYRNARKDRPGTTRLEARPLGGVTSNLGPQDIVTHLYAKARSVATALRVAMLLRHGTDPL
jgi:hypothetical protein